METQGAMTERVHFIAAHSSALHSAAPALRYVRELALKDSRLRGEMKKQLKEKGLYVTCKATSRWQS